MECPCIRWMDGASTRHTCGVPPPANTILQWTGKPPFFPHALLPAPQTASKLPGVPFPQSFRPRGRAMPLPMLTLRVPSKPENRPLGLTNSTKLLFLQMPDFATLKHFNCWQPTFNPTITTHTTLLSPFWERQKLLGATRSSPRKLKVQTE